MTSTPPKLGSVEKLNTNHKVESFDCGSEPLNRFLKSHALGNQKAGGVQTYVVCRHPDLVVGFYSICVGGVEYDHAPQRVAKGLAKHPIPVMLLARLAVDQTEQRHGLGRALLKDSLLRTAQAAEIAGIRALLVHAKDERAKAWYEDFDFEPSPTDPLHLFLLMKDIQAILKG